MESEGKTHQSKVGKGELKEEHGKEVVGRETTSFINAENIVKDSEKQHREKGDEDE
jgi:hypothetical protein